jgi:hypothetical protein
MPENLTKIRVTVRFDVEIPVEGCQLREIEEWLRYGFRDDSLIAINNPLYSYEPEPILDSFVVIGSDGNQN